MGLSLAACSAERTKLATSTDVGAGGSGGGPTSAIRVLDADGRLWLLFRDALSIEKPATICRLDGKDLTCGLVPGSGGAHLQVLHPIDGGAPLVAIRSADGTVFRTPFEWGEALPGTKYFPKSGAAMADGTAFLTDGGSIKMREAAGTQRVVLEAAPGRSVEIVGDHAFVVETEGDRSRVAAVPLGRDGLGQARELGRVDGTVDQVCRDGTTVGIRSSSARGTATAITLASLDAPDWVTSEAWVNASRSVRGRLACRHGVVSWLGVDPLRPDEEVSGTRCTPEGCRSFGDLVAKTDLHQGDAALLPDGRYLYVAADISSQPGRLVTAVGEAGAPGALQRPAIAATSDRELFETPAGVLENAAQGLLAFDEHGAHVRLELRWTGERPVSVDRAR